MPPAFECASKSCSPDTVLEVEAREVSVARPDRGHWIRWRILLDEVMRDVSVGSGGKDGLEVDCATTYGGNPAARACFHVLQVQRCDARSEAPNLSGGIAAAARHPVYIHLKPEQRRLGGSQKQVEWNRALHLFQLERMIVVAQRQAAAARGGACLVQDIGELVPVLKAKALLVGNVRESDPVRAEGICGVEKPVPAAVERWSSDARRRTRESGAIEHRAGRGRLTLRIVDVHVYVAVAYLGYLLERALVVTARDIADRLESEADAIQLATRSVLETWARHERGGGECGEGADSAPAVDRDFFDAWTSRSHGRRYGSVAVPRH